MPKRGAYRTTTRRSHPAPDPYTAKIVKAPSKKRLKDTLHAAVRRHDLDALEDYDEQTK